MLKIESDLRGLGGVARRDELVSLGNSADLIDLMATYARTIIRVRKGWYAVRDADPMVLSAWRVGGRLACVSAVAHHGIALPEAELPGAEPSGVALSGAEPSGVNPELHVSVAPNASRLSARSPNIVLHWSDTVPLSYLGPGSRSAVPVREAIAQMLRCPAARAISGELLARLARMPVGGATDTL